MNLGQKSRLLHGPKSAESVSRPLIRDMERVPKPPKYPLYDLDSISLATPPPPPAMHPSSSLPVEDYFLRRHDNNYNGGRQDDYRGRHENNHKNNNNKNNRHDKNDKRNHANRRRGQPTNTQSNRRNDKNNQRQEYFSHPMATNIEPVKVSPALGRPLGYSEFMARPSNSFLDDPWNFDPFKQEMNAGLETSGLKYNYDPLGMETAESDSESMKHLTIKGSSFLGDSHIQGNVVKQVGGYELQGNNYQDANYNNHGNGYDSLAGASENNIQKNHQQKIEFTIETNADGGVSIEPVVDAQMTAPIGPSGYENFPRNGENDPSDMLPPIGSYSYSHGNGYNVE